MSYTESSEENRSHWEFEYTARVLADAAATKKVFRQSRVEWWEQQQKEVMATVRESGIDVSEAIGAAYSNTTAMHGPQITVRIDLQKKLSECHTKIREHQNAVREYDGWHQVLTANPEARLKLKHGDWLFFFGQ